jgi:hypothetical protein
MRKLLLTNQVAKKGERIGCRYLKPSTPRRMPAQRYPTARNALLAWQCCASSPDARAANIGR